MKKEIPSNNKEHKRPVHRSASPVAAVDAYPVRRQDRAPDACVRIDAPD